ncbi:MAG TPA: hypothetical protein EYN66_11900 [Myxococcales bacterium]|nr:hypothetical protein [Myxococcales bacterium]
MVGVVEYDGPDTFKKEYDETERAMVENTRKGERVLSVSFTQLAQNEKGYFPNVRVYFDALPPSGLVILPVEDDDRQWEPDYAEHLYTLEQKLDAMMDADDDS